jgi:hypothetical protein
MVQYCIYLENKTTRKRHYVKNIEAMDVRDAMIEAQIDDDLLKNFDIIAEEDIDYYADLNYMEER